MRLLTLERAAEWKWSGDGSAVAGKQACDAAVAVVRFVLDEMTKPATHGAQRRPLALTLAMVLGQIGRGGADPADIATAVLPVAELAAPAPRGPRRKTPPPRTRRCSRRWPR